MNIVTILKQVPTIVSLLENITKAFASDTPPPSPPAVIPPGTAAHPSAAIKDLQALLNKLVKPTPPLDEDGWLGPKTEAAIEGGIAMLKAQGVG